MRHAALVPELDAARQVCARLHARVAELYPICRSITGEGVRETLRRLQALIPLEIHEVPSGAAVFDWTVPREWTVRDAYVADSRGVRVIDFRRDVVARIGSDCRRELDRVSGNPVHDRKLFAVPFKHHAAHRHHIPKPRYRVTNWPEYDAALRQRGSLTVWFTDEVIAAWQAQARTTPGGQPQYSRLAITTALTLRAVFGLALRQTEGLIGSLIDLLGLDLAVPDHSTLSRRARTLLVPLRRKLGTGPLHLLVDSTGVKLGGAGEWLIEKHGTSRRRSWRKLHIGIDGDSGEIVAIELTRRDIDGGSRTDALLDQLTDPLASFTGDGAYDQDKVYGAIAARHRDAAVIVPPRATAVSSAAAEMAPTQRDLHLQTIAEHGRMSWQKSSGYNRRARVEASIGRYKRVISDALRSRTDAIEATEVAIAAAALNRMLQFGCPSYARIV